jgi:mannose-1-phosphate guanylyltransferase
MRRVAVILAGGSGTRLRPLSSDENPKQFLRLFEGHSLLQRTWSRLRRILPPESIFVSTNEAYRAKSIEHLPEMPLENMITEPARRNTGPAIALCTLTIADRMGDVTVAFLPADHYIADEAEFVRVLDRAFRYAESNDDFVTIGIKAVEPNTEYGYLELGQTLEPGVVRLRRFTEKPSRDKAEAFLAAGNYAWNAGMFVWRTSVFHKELERVAPELARVTLANYETMPAISIDYAVMEKAERIATLPGDFGWSDVGSFEALERVGVVLPAGIRPAHR